MGVFLGVDLILLAGVDFLWKVNFLAGEDALSGLSGLERNLLRVATSCRHATVFVDHYSRLSYVHVNKTANADDAIAAKKAFEQHARERGVTIKHCHADNGIFKSAAFLKEVT